MKIKVYVTRVSNRPNYHLQWDDPMTQRQRRQATDVPASNLSRDRKAAERLAAQLEVELNNGSAAIPSKFKWADLRDRYESLILPGLARQTRVKVRVVLDRVERILNPIRLQDVTEGRLAHFVAELRKAGIAETTIKGYIGHLKSALNWAVEQKLLLTRIKFPKVQRSKRSNGTPMKGRAPTAEEFDRMIAAVPKIVGNARAADSRQLCVLVRRKLSPQILFPPISCLQARSWTSSLGLPIPSPRVFTNPIDLANSLIPFNSPLLNLFMSRRPLLSMLTSGMDS
jgi:hypothetical protein